MYILVSPKHIQNKSPMWILFVDVIVLIGECTLIDLETWTVEKNLETRNFSLRKTKTEYMKYSFRNNIKNDEIG